MSESNLPSDFGRVEADGTVYVTTADGERSVGQVPDVDPSEALAFFVRRFEALDTEVNLLEQRVASGTVNPDEARRTISHLTTTITEANAVGDLAGLVARLEALKPLLAERVEARRAERATQVAETKAAKEAMVVEAEKLATGNDWRGGVNRFRSLLDQWKALPRIDRATDDDLWHRFSTARTTYTRRRKAQFADQAGRREESRKAKEALIAEARQLASSTEWGPTSGAFRDLMTQWKAAGAAPREVDDALWAEFRGLQDQFFNARNSAQNEQDAEFKANQVAKEALLDQAEATILPIKDLGEARSAFREFLGEYNAYGKVPRDAIRPLDGRVRRIETALKEAEAAEWRRTDPEARQRASDTVNMFQAQIDKLGAQLEKAQAKGDQRKIKELTDSIQTYTSWLDSASRTLEEFSS